MNTSLDTAILQKQDRQTTFGARISSGESAGQTTSTHGQVQSIVPMPIQAPATALNVICPQTINYNPTPTL
jgi:hypothetical protein